MQIYTGLDLSRKRLDWYSCAGDGQLVDRGAVPPDPDGLAQLVRRLGDTDVLADRYVPLLCTVAGIAWVLAYTIASEIGDLRRFASPRTLIGYTGLCPRLYQSGEQDRRGALSKHGPDYLRWALVEAAHTAARQPLYQPTVARQRDRHGRRRGSAIAAITIARQIAEAIWWMLTRNQPFAPAGAKSA
jgi:transposase